MQMLRNYPYLTGLLMLLVVLKFMLVPLIQWQNDTLWNIKQHDKRLGYAEAAISNVDSNSGQLVTLQTELKKLQGLFYVNQDEASFKLEQQQWLEALLAKHNIKVTNIGWGFSSKMLAQPIIKHQLSIFLHGQTHALPGLHLDLEANEQWVELSGFMFNVKGQNQSALGRVTGKLELFFYQLDSSAINSVGEANE